MKKSLMSLIAAICMSCPGQWVITNYVYTVSNITFVTQNEITQNVNRAYNYYSTNFTVNVETNLYIDKVIGTNVVYEFKTNYYDIVILTNISTMVWTNILVTIPTNYDVTVNLSTNIYQTNHNTSVTHTYETTINTNVIYNIITNEYADLVIGTNVVMEIRMTNGEEIVILTSNILSRARASANAASTYADRSRRYSEDSYASSTNAYYNARDAMLYAYVTTDTAIRLASTNAIAFYTNSYEYVDINGKRYTNILALACNDMNGIIEASCNYRREMNAPSYGISRASLAYTLRLSIDQSSNYRYSDMFLSHCAQSATGMEIYYLPTGVHSVAFGTSSYFYPEFIYWKTNCLHLSIYIGDIDKPKSSDSRSFWILRKASDSDIDPWPDSFGNYQSDITFGTGTSKQMTKMYGSSPLSIRIKTSYLSSVTNRLYVPSFPTLHQWKIMWLESLQLGTQIR